MTATAPRRGARQLPVALRAAEREWQFFRRIWRRTVFTTFASPILLLVALGVGLGGLIDDADRRLGGLGYLEFLAPGLAVAAAVQLAAGLGLWPIMAGHRWIGFHRAMAMTEIAPRQIATGYLVWITARSTLQAAVFGVVAAALGAVSSPLGILAAPIAGLTAGAFAAPLIAYTATCDSDASFDPIMRLGATPLYLFSGSFFPLDQLPVALQVVAQLFPLWHGIELARAATTATAPAWHPLLHLTVITLWLVAGILTARRTFTKRLTP